MPRASQLKLAFWSKDVLINADSQQNRGPGPRALSKSGARGPSGMALFNYCNGLVGRGSGAPCDGSPAPAPGPRTNGGGRGRGVVQPGLAVRAQNIGFLAQVLAGALCARPPPARPRPGILPLHVVLHTPYWPVDRLSRLTFAEAASAAAVRCFWPTVRSFCVVGVQGPQGAGGTGARGPSPTRPMPRCPTPLHSRTLILALKSQKFPLRKKGRCVGSGDGRKMQAVGEIDSVRGADWSGRQMREKGITTSRATRGSCLQHTRVNCSHACNWGKLGQGNDVL
jgi:hypothetical protein